MDTRPGRSIPVLVSPRAGPEVKSPPRSHSLLPVYIAEDHRALIATALQWAFTLSCLSAMTPKSFPESLLSRMQSPRNILWVLAVKLPASSRTLCYDSQHPLGLGSETPSILHGSVLQLPAFSVHLPRQVCEEAPSSLPLGFPCSSCPAMKPKGLLA